MLPKDSRLSEPQGGFVPSLFFGYYCHSRTGSLAEENILKKKIEFIITFQNVRSLIFIFNNFF